MICDETQSEIGQRAVLAARSLVGTPFHHAARVPGVGIDCAGLLVVVAQRVGLNPLDNTTYSRAGSLTLLHASLATCADEADDCRPGDALIFSGRHAPCHTGIYTGNGHMIHAHYVRGVTVERMGRYWSSICAQSFRWRAV